MAGTIRLVVAGRKELDDLFEKSDVLFGRLPHHPFLVFEQSASQVKVHVVDSARKLKNFNPSCKVMVQWPGKWRSDFFQMTVGDVLAAREEAQGDA